MYLIPKPTPFDATLNDKKNKLRAQIESCEILIQAIDALMRSPVNSFEELLTQIPANNHVMREAIIYHFARHAARDQMREQAAQDHRWTEKPTEWHQLIDAYFKESAESGPPTSPQTFINILGCVRHNIVTIRRAAEYELEGLGLELKS